MSDRHISKKLNGKVVANCVISACIYRLETVALFGAEQQLLQVSHGIKGLDRRRLDDIREEIGMNMGITERVIRGHMRWAGHVDRMDGGRLPKMTMSHVGWWKGKGETMFEMEGLC